MPPQYTYEQLMALDEQARLSGAAPGVLPQGTPEDEEQGESQGINPLKVLWRTAKAAARGAGRAFNEITDTATEVLEESQNLIGELKSRHPIAGLEEEDYVAVAIDNPVRIPIREERDSGFYGFVEGVSQFAAASVGFGKLLKGVKLLKGAGSLRRSAAVGALVDLTAFDPYEERLSDLIQNSWAANPLTAMLQSDEDDSEAVARLKQMAEGLILGSTIDRLVAGVRAFRTRRMVKAGKLSEEEGLQKIKEIFDGVEESADDIVTVEHTPGEPSRLRVRQENLFDDETMKALTEEGSPIHVEFDSPAQAEAVGASMNYALKNDMIPRASLSEEQRAAVKASVSRLLSGENPEEVLRGTAPQLNLAHVQTADDAKAWIKAFGEEAAEEAKRLVNRQSDGGGQKWEETILKGLSWIEGVSDEEMLDRLTMVLGTDDAATIYGARVWVHAKAQQAMELSQKIETSPDPRILQARFDRVLDSLWEGHNMLAGIMANQARGLDAGRIPVDPADFPRVQTKIHDVATEGAARGAAEGAEAAVEGTARRASKSPNVETQNLTRSGKSNLPSNAQHIRTLVDPTEKLSEALTMSEKRALGRAIMFSGGDPTRVLDAIRTTRWVKQAPQDPSRWEKALAWRANMMLSGPKTHLVNFISTLGVSLQVPMEYWWAGKRTGNEALAQMGTDMFKQNALQLLDTAQSVIKALAYRNGEHLNPIAQAVRRTWRQGDNVLDPMMSPLEHKSYTTPGVGWLDRLVNAPSRALMASDEFFKQMNYRSHVTAQSLRLSREQGITDPKRIAERLAEDLHMAFDVEGGATNVTALEHSRYSTLSQKLEPGTRAGDFQKYINDHPEWRVVFPFFRTPVNIFKFTWHRTPVLNRLSKEVRADLAAGGERAALAKARIEAGTAMYSMAALLAFQGAITGSGPKEPTMRRQWLDAGNQPYSVKVGDLQISYQRLEPIATPLALVADVFQVSGELEESTLENTIAAVVAGMMSSVTSKTFLLGMSQFFEAVSSNEGWRVRQVLLQDLPLSFAIPNLARQMNSDPVWRETRSILEEAQSRVPWMSEGLEPRRNIFGEPVMRPPGYANRAFNPFTVMKAPKDDDVAQALVDLGRAFPMPRPTREGGRIDLSDRRAFDNGTGQSPYDRMLQLMAEPPGNLPPLRQAMEALVKSKAWQNASAGSEAYPGGARWMLANDLISRYQNMAEKQVLKEYPRLREAIVGERTLKRQSILGALDQ